MARRFKIHYTIQTTTKSHCGNCHTYLDLLCEDNLNKKTPTMFYICWRCKRVYEVGAGEVPREGYEETKTKDKTKANPDATAL